MYEINFFSSFEGIGYLIELNWHFRDVFICGIMKIILVNGCGIVLGGSICNSFVYLSFSFASCSICSHNHRKNGVRPFLRFRIANNRL